MDLVLHVANETYLTLHDPRHNLLSIADSTGTVAAGNSLRYEPFGTPSVGATTSGIEPRFGGMRYLPGTQLYLSDTRLMDPRHGAWLSPDPLGYVDSPNLYAYARQNPIDFVDPSGRGLVCIRPSVGEARSTTVAGLSSGPPLTRHPFFA